MEDKLKTEIEQKVCSLIAGRLRTELHGDLESHNWEFVLLQETEAQLALSKAEEMAKAELISAIAKEKAAHLERMAEVDLNVSKNETLYFISY